MDVSHYQQLKNLKEHPDWLESVLIVDDDPITLDALTMTLESLGMTIHSASTGEAALDILEKTPLAAIISDFKLTDMTGLEILKQAVVLQPNASRIVITGSANLDEAADLVNVAHISHFILKPWENKVLIQAVQSAVEKFNLIRENRRLSELNVIQNQELKRNQESLKHELSIGGRVQNLLLEGKVPKSLPGVQITGLTVPSREIDGDFFEFYQLAPHIVDFVIGDVMGKGLPSALVATAMKFQLAHYAAPPYHSLAHKKDRGWHVDLMSPSDILKHVSVEMVPSLIKLEYFVSLLYGRFNFKTRSFSFVDCGSTKPLHYHALSGRVVEIKGDNFPLGIGLASEEYSERKVTFQADDLMIFYSDGITEALSPGGSLFGKERLGKLIQSHPHLSPNELIELIKQEVTHFTQKEGFDDDLTLMIFKFTECSGIEEFSSEDVAKFNSDLSQLRAVRKFVESLCLTIMEEPSAFSTQMQLVADEIFCNIVHHSYKGQKGHQIIIQGGVENDTLVFEFFDQGDPFDPSLINHPNLQGEKVGGFGFYLVKEIAEKVNYERKKSENGWNCLRISKKICYQGEQMDLSHRKENDVIIVKLEGANLDAQEAPHFKQQINDLISKEGSHQVVLDLEDLNFIDSTGLGCFLSLMRTLNNAKGDIKLANMSSPIHTIFELVCMHKIFEIYDSVEAAVVAFEQPQT